MKIGDKENLFEKTISVKTLIKNKSAKTLIDNNLSLGKASGQ